MSNCLVVPLAGYGKKFLRAGYTTLKPFLKIDQANNMLDLIVRDFPKNIKKIFIVRKNIQIKYLKILKKYKNSEIFFVEPHNLGPLYSLYLIKDDLKTYFPMVKLQKLQVLGSEEYNKIKISITYNVSNFNTSDTIDLTFQ